MFQIKKKQNFFQILGSYLVGGQNALKLDSKIHYAIVSISYTEKDTQTGGP
jgi:hypothetical protein